MISFTLDKFHLHFPEKLLDLANQSMDKIAVKVVGGREAWIVHFGMPVEHEIKINITKNKVVSYFCDCDHFQFNRSCFHIPAAIKAIYDKHDSGVKHLKKPDAARKIHISSLLKQLSEKELSDFILQYSRADKKMALALKSRFAYKINTLDNRRKYLDLVNQFAGSKKTENFHASDLKKLGIYCENLVGLSDDIRSLGNLLESYAILSALLFFLNSRSLSDKSKIFEKVTIGIHERIHLFLNREAAPVFKQSIFKDLVAVLTQTHYQIPRGKINLYRLLLQWRNFHSFGKLAFKKLIDRVTQDISESLQLELVFLEWCFEMDRVNEIHLIYRTFNKRPEFVDLSSKAFERTELMPKLTTVLYTVYNETSSRTTKHNCFKVLEDYYLRKGNHKLQNLRLDYLIFQPEKNLFISLKEMHADNWGSSRKKIIDILEEKDRKEDLALIYTWDGDYAALLEFTMKTASLPLLNAHVHTIYPVYPGQTIQLYKDLLSSYLEKHIGPKSSYQVREVFNSLNKSGLSIVSGEIKQYLFDKFEERFFTSGLKLV